MKTFFAEPKTASQAAFITRIMDRANSLWLDGYTYVTDECGDIIAVVKPGCEWPLAELNKTCYATDADGCSCEGFKENEDCKHRIAVMLKQAELNEIRDSRMW